MPELLAEPRPEVAPEVAEEVASRVYGVALSAAAPLAGERDRNFRLETAQGPLCLKIANRLEPAGVLEMQALALEHVARVDPELPVPRLVRTPAGHPVATIELADVPHAVQLVTFLPGAPPDPRDATPATRAEVGRIAARLDRALRGFFHREAGRVLLWDVTRLAALRPHLARLAPERRGRAAAWLDRFEAEVRPKLGGLRAQPIHNDLNQGNLLVDPDEPARLTGIVDFGDLVHAPLVVEVAVAAAYQCFAQPNVESCVREVVVAYHGVSPLEPEELALLPPLAACRLVQSILIAAWRETVDPANAEYILADGEEAWESLRRLDALDPGDLAERIQIACGPAPVAARVPARPFEDSLARRRERLGPALALSYDEPVRPVAGEGVWLVEASGARVLDAYNNVPHVGHSHPAVVAAVDRQTRRLTTNTRYLVDEVVDYADRLAALLPDPLDVVMFVNSGSEANDLAYQIACVVTGRRGVVLTEHAYHGCTWATTAMSPEEFGLGRLEPWTVTIPAPYPCREGPAVERSLDAAFDRLAASGHEPAMWIADSIFSSDGIFPPPAGYLEAVYRHVHAAGGLCVADEVQAGFGRVGPPFWGFALGDTVPDVVTLGKPMGNGYPMGAVVTTTEIASAFAAGWHFFSTFAGSPVAAAAGGAVLDVLEREHLPERATATGEHLRERLRALREETPVIGDVRGAGLFTGVEVTEAAGDPAAAAERIVNAMRRRRVLIGRTGPGGNVLKIRPPLVFGEEHADLLVEALAAALDESREESR
jgi:4-aminobutyrate aminotransferase-like enzyme/Ser/Thr protein kinase RdoA (MazF antagonist)